jgi:hypothetical protein
MITLGLPFVTLSHGKVWAVPGKSPTIVQRPNNLDIVLFYVFEKHRKVNIPAVQVVQMYYIRTKAFQLTNQSEG